ncbi:hypothetical protein TNCV_2206101 [Trichonephila clavipes]|nr:hypothetical protein TNCV_2206101 [Trichonephila clavipes]
MCKLGRKVENIVRNHNYIGKHGRKAIGGAVSELARSAHIVRSFQTWTVDDEYKSLYERRVGGYPLHQRHSQRKWTYCSSVEWGKISNEAQIIKRSLGCIRIWRNMDLSEP